jgi:hypothetical protein
MYRANFMYRAIFMYRAFFVYRQDAVPAGHRGAL